MILLDTLASMQRAALVLLVVYGAVAIILLPRELTFLAGVGQPSRRWFAALDVLIQLCILSVLIPCAIGEPAMAVDRTASRQLPWGWVSVSLGFVGMWITTIWAMAVRYRYITQLLAKVRQDSAIALRELTPQPPTEDQPHD